MENSHRRHNHISSIEVKAVRFEEESAIRDHVVQFYTTLYQGNLAWWLDANGLPFQMIEEEAQKALERRFEKDEIIQVIHDMQGDKAPGPDCYLMAFFQH